MTKEKFLYGLNACAVTYHNGQKLYEHDELVKCFEDLGIFEQEPKTGRWIAQDIHNCHTDFKCSECGYIHNFMHLYGEPTADYSYCPNCGAKMEESEGKE